MYRMTALLLELSIFWLELHARYNQQVMDPKHITTSFQYSILCVLTHITLTLQDMHVHGHSTYWMAALLSEMSISCVRSGCKILQVSYGSKHTSQCLFDKAFAHTYVHNLKTAGDIRTFYISNSCSTIRRFLVCFRVAWEIRLESYDPRHSSYSKIAVWCAAMHDNKTHVPYDCILHTNWQLH